MVVLLAVDCWRKGIAPPRGLWAAMICFIVLLSPQNELIVHGERFGGQVKCLTLLALAYVALRMPLEGEAELRTQVITA